MRSQSIHIVYYAQRGPRFLGQSLAAETHEDLLQAVKLEGASQVMSLEDEPGGGSLVTLYDAEGLPINLIHEPEPAETRKSPKTLILNYETDKPRNSTV